MLKATAGGGGRGIRMVASADDLEDAYQRTRDEAERAFGSGVVFLERLVTGARHVEVQVIADGQGTAWAIGVRDCSIQRRNQKVIEESASPLLDEEQVADLKASAERLALAVGLPRRRHRRVPLPPGRAHLRVPRGQHPAPGRAPDHRGHHRHRPGQGPDPRRRRRPPRGRAPGRDRARRRGAAERRGPRPRLRAVPRPDRAARPPVRTGHPGRHRGRRGRHHPRRLRLDDRQDHRPRPHPRGGPRPAAPRDGRDHRRHRGRRHQQELHPRAARPARGRRRDRRLGRHRLDRPGPRRGPARRPAALRDRPGRRRDRGLRGGARDRGRPTPRDRPRRPSAGPAPGRTRRRPEAARHGVQGRRPSRSARTATGWRSPTARPSRSSTPTMEPIDAFRSRLVGRRSPLPARDRHPRPDHLVEVDGVTHRVSRDEGGVLRSPAPALVVATPAAVGDVVPAGAPLVVLESMKMETVLTRAVPGPGAGAAGLDRRPGGDRRTPDPGRARRGRRRAGAGGRGADRTRPRPARQPSASSTPQQRYDRARADLSALLLGFDAVPGAEEAPPWRGTSPRATSCVPTGVSVFTDEARLLAHLRRPRRAEPQPAGRGGAAHRAARAQHRRALPHLPAEPRRRARRAARPLPGPAAGPSWPTSGSPTWTARPTSRRRCSGCSWPSSTRPGDLQLVTTLLQLWIDEPAPEGELAGEIRLLLERLVRATQLRFPVVRDLARSVRFRWFDQPVVDEERSSVLAGVGDEVAALAGDDAADSVVPHRGAGRDPRADRRLPRRAARGRRTRREPMLEVLIRRHYREFDLHDLRTLERRRRGPSRSPTTSSTSGPPAWSPPSARWPSWRHPADRSRPPSASRSPPAAPATPWSTSTCPGPRRRSPPTRRAPSWPGWSTRCPSLATSAGSRSRSAPVAADRSATSPSARPRTARSSRTTWSAACTRWWAAGSTCGGCASSTSPGSTRPRTSCSTSASPARTPPTGGWSRSRRCASSPSYATRRAR